MRTNIEAIDIVWQTLNNSLLKSAIDGKIYKSSRPTNSKMEDVVINSLPITSGTPQLCIVNVNIYTRNLQLKINGTPDNSMPDNQRLNELTAIAFDVLNHVSGGDYFFYVEQQAIIKEEQLLQHYSNIRVEFLFTN